MKHPRTILHGMIAAAIVGLLGAGDATALDVGQKAPDFTLAAPGNKQVKLADMLGKGPVVIYTFVDAFGAAWTEEISGFEANLAQFEAANAHVVGVSADPVSKLEEFTRKNTIKHQILSDFGRTMLPAYGVMVTDQKSPMYRLAKRAYFIVDRQGIVRFARVQANPLDLLKTEDVLKALKGLGAWIRPRPRWLR
jgi:peroxiredoxin